jgi:hypothetical protein
MWEVIRRTHEHVTLETELILQNRLHRILVLASERAVQLLIRTHDTTGSCPDCLGKGVDVQFVSCRVIDCVGEGEVCLRQ